MWNTIFVFGVLIFLVAPTCWAQPHGTVRWLMDQRVSLFDWGLYRLNEHLKDLAAIDVDSGSRPMMWGAVYYLDRIIISGTPTNIAAKDLETAKEWARSAAANLREGMLVSSATGEKIVDGAMLPPGMSAVTGMLTIADCFSAYLTTSVPPDDLATQLEQICDLSIVIRYGDIPQRKLLAQGPLLSAQLTFQMFDK